MKHHTRRQTPHSSSIDFKDSFLALHWLETALDMEKAKYAACPVKNDLVAGQVNAQAWGSVVTGYFLLEQAFKLLLHVEGTSPDKTHTLSTDLFDALPEDDQKALQESYADFRLTGGNARTFPFSDLNDFLRNLDGNDGKGKPVGSFDWRYFLIEHARGNALPTVSIEFLHEVVYAVACLIEHKMTGKSRPAVHTYSRRKHRERQRVYRDWVPMRRASSGPDRIEILWGPDVRNRYDYAVFRGGSVTLIFGELPSDSSLPRADVRNEAKDFALREGLSWQAA